MMASQSHNDDDLHRLTEICQHLLDEYKNNQEKKSEEQQRFKEYYPMVLDVAVEHHFSASTLARLFLETFQLTCSICTWSLFDLAAHSLHQEALVREMDEMMGRRLPPKLEEVAGLGRTQAFVRESMRCHSPLPICSRKLKETMQCGEITIKPESVVNLAVGLVNTLEVNHSEPSVFNPIRFTAANQEERFLGSNSAGECIGIHVTKAILAVLLQQYYLRLERSDEATSSLLIPPFNMCFPDHHFNGVFARRPTPSTM